MKSALTAQGGLLLARLGVSVILLVILAAYLDLDRVIDRLGNLEARWVAPAVAISLLQVVLSAWRWRFTAGRLGIRLPFVAALREYAIASFLNQVLPGGVGGDLGRAWRHSRALPPGLGGRALRAVVLERASGQLVMLAVAGGSLIWLSAPPMPMAVPLLGMGLLVLVVSALFAWDVSRPRATDSLVRRVWDDSRAALLSLGALPAQLISSVLVVTSYITVYLLMARAVGVETPASMLLPLVAPVLVAMLIPATIAGWGVREAAAAFLWNAAGLPVADGVAISVAYGLLVLATSLPGAVIFIVRPAARFS